MNTPVILACLIIATICTVGVFSKKFDDTLIQRISLAGCSLSSLGIAYRLHEFQYMPPSVDMLIMSIALWCMATFWKYSNGRK
jgi:hypothetical protein